MAVFIVVITTVFTVDFEGDFVAYCPVAFTATPYFLKFRYWETGNLLKKQTPPKYPSNMTLNSLKHPQTYPSKFPEELAE